MYAFDVMECLRSKKSGCGVDEYISDGWRDLGVGKEISECIYKVYDANSVLA